MSSGDVRVDRMLARVRKLEGLPIENILAAAREETEAIKFPLGEQTLRMWAQAVHHGERFSFRVR